MFIMISQDSARSTRLGSPCYTPVDDDGAQLVKQLLKEIVDSLMILVIFDGDVEWFVAVDVDDFGI